MGENGKHTRSGSAARPRMRCCLAAVLGVLSLLGGCVWLALWARARWRESLCIHQLHTVGSALALYCHDYDDTLPPGMEQVARLPDYGYGRRVSSDVVAFDPECYRCPTDPNQESLGAIANWDLDADQSARCSYDCKLAYPPIPDKVSGGEPLMWDIDGGNPKSPRANHRHGPDSWGNVLYFDGRARRVPHREWPQDNWPPTATDAGKRHIGAN